jgi:hypothetical protein
VAAATVEQQRIRWRSGPIFERVGDTVVDVKSGYAVVALLTGG